MPLTSDFVRELFAAANQIDMASISERRRLVERAASTIKEQRERLVDAGNVFPMTLDITEDLPELLQHFGDLPPQLIAVALIRCADEIVRLGRLLETD